MNRTIPPLTDQLGRVAVFVEVVRSGSFAAAGRALGLARSTISEQIGALETAFEARLLERSTRRLRLTPEGTLLFGRAAEMLRVWAETCEALEARRLEPVGPLRISAPSRLAASLVAPAANRLMAESPGISLRLLVGDAPLDLFEAEVDLVVRMGALPDSPLMSRRLGETPRVLVASPEVAQQISGPESLHRLPWVGHQQVMWQVIHLRGPRGEVWPVTPTYRAVADATEGLVALVAGGAGVALLPALLMQRELANGQLTHVLPELEGERVPYWALYPSRRFLPARTRRLIELLAEGDT